MAQRQESYFWTSYSDLMTSLFFVMLVLFVLANAMLKNKVDEVEEQNVAIEKQKVIAEKQKEATEKELAKIREIEASIKAIDHKYFEYNPLHKKHILKINVQFTKGSSDIEDIPPAQRQELVAAGRAIAEFLRNSPDGVKYLLIIEGQASNDDYPYNDQLSFERALVLKRLWKGSGLSFSDKCEVIVAGSGKDGVLRAQPDNESNEKNQRFLIHIIPKPGVIERIEQEIK